MCLLHAHKGWTMMSEVEKRLVPNLQGWDTCYYYLNRINGDYSASTANQRIANFKHSLERYHDRSDVLRYKEQEIRNFGVDLFWHLSDDYSAVAACLDVALVPINTSRPQSDPYYDDRLVRMCEVAASMTGGAVRSCDVMHSRERMHESHYGGTRSVYALRSNLVFDGFGEKVPNVVILVDDVLTTGAHFAVCRDAILERYGHEGEIYVDGAFLCIHRSRSIDYGANGIKVTW